MSRCFDSNGLSNVGSPNTVAIHVNVPDTVCGTIVSTAVVDPSNVQAETDESVPDNQEPETTDVFCADLDLAQYDDPDAAPSFVGSQNDELGPSGGPYTSYNVFVLHNDGVQAIGAMTFGGVIGGNASRTSVTISALAATGSWICPTTDYDFLELQGSLARTTMSITTAVQTRWRSSSRLSAPGPTTKRHLQRQRSRVHEPGAADRPDQQLPRRRL